MARSLTALVGREVRREGAFSDALSVFGDGHAELLDLTLTFDARERTIGEGSTKLDELAGRGLLLLAHHDHATSLDGRVGLTERDGAALLLAVDRYFKVEYARPREAGLEEEARAGALRQAGAGTAWAVRCD